MLSRSPPCEPNMMIGTSGSKSWTSQTRSIETRSRPEYSWKLNTLKLMRQRTLRSNYSHPQILKSSTLPLQFFQWRRRDRTWYHPPPPKGNNEVFGGLVFEGCWPTAKRLLTINFPLWKVNTEVIPSSPLGSPMTRENPKGWKFFYHAVRARAQDESKWNI